ncbi:MAG: peptidyl-prolyl cis-trans isomerase, partial [Dehalococcoidia bacterium]|nr:peptidyl-prolyl cis-trans isomerase [Dehalococcoidia bacterium]
FLESGEKRTPTPTSTPPLSTSSADVVVPLGGQATPAAASTPTQTPAGPTPTPSPTVSPTEAMNTFKTTLSAQPFLTESEYRYWVVGARLLRYKLGEALGNELASAAEQVRARQVLLSDEETAKAIIERLQKGEDFAKLAQEFSKDSQTKDKGGDLGWFPKGVMIPQFEEVAFVLKPGELSPAPVKTQYGYQVIKVEERDANRPLSPEYFEQLKSKAMQDWLLKQQPPIGKSVTPLLSPDTYKWAQSYIDRAPKP